MTVTALLALMLYAAPSFGTLTWESNHPERTAWSAALIVQTTALLPRLEKAADIGRFCPLYSVKRPVADRAQIWSELIVAVAYYESGWRPAEHYREPPPLGYDSIGLLQLSYEDKQYKFCDLTRATKSLEDPLKNLACGLGIFAQLVERYSAITTKQNKGAAAYWSTLRENRKLPQVLARMRKLVLCRRPAVI